MGDIKVLDSMRSRFYDRLDECIRQKKDNHLYISDQRYKELIKEVKDAKVEEKKKSVHYRRLKRFDIMTIGEQDVLIVPFQTEGGSVLYYVPYGELFQVIHETHIKVGHGGRNRVLAEAGRKYKDLIDMQSKPDSEYKFILVYKDHRTKFVILRALRFTDEVASNLVDVFTTFGAPCILYSNSGREFCSTVIDRVCEMWREIRIVNGKLRHESQSSGESGNQDVENMVATWMSTNKTSKWSEGLKFIQAVKNRGYDDGMKCSPYEMMFGVPMRLGLTSSVLPCDVEKLNSEEELETILGNINENQSHDEDDNVSDDAQANNVEHSISSKKKTGNETQTSVQDINQVPQLPNTSELNQNRINKAERLRQVPRENPQIQAKKMKKTISNEEFPQVEAKKMKKTISNEEFPQVEAKKMKKTISNEEFPEVEAKKMKKTISNEEFPEVEAEKMKKTISNEEFPEVEAKKMKKTISNEEFPEIEAKKMKKTISNEEFPEVEAKKMKKTISNEEFPQIQAKKMKKTISNEEFPQIEAKKMKKTISNEEFPQIEAEKMKKTISNEEFPEVEQNVRMKVEYVDPPEFDPLFINPVVIKEENEDDLYQVENHSWSLLT